MKVGVIANMVDPNRVALFERVAARSDVRLFVVYETVMESNREWRPTLDLPYPHALLHSRSIDLRKLGTDAYLHLAARPLAPFGHEPPDVMIGAGGGIWSSPANAAAFLSRRRRGWAFAPWWGSFEKERPSTARRVADVWIRWFLRSSDACLAYGSRASSELVRLGVPSERVFIVPNAPREPLHEPRPRAPRSGPIRFLFVGQLIERKGLDVLLAAFSELPGAHQLRIVGAGPLQEQVELAAAADPRIQHQGHADWAELQEAYAEADVLVLPSRYEVWGLVVNEAMAHGCAVVVSEAVGAADDLLEPDVTGYVVEPGSRDALLRALRELDGWEPGRWAKAAARGRARVGEWSLSAAADRFVEACAFAHDRHRATTLAPGRASA